MLQYFKDSTLVLSLLLFSISTILSSQCFAMSRGGTSVDAIFRAAAEQTKTVPGSSSPQQLLRKVAEVQEKVASHSPNDRWLELAKKHKLRTKRKKRGRRRSQNLPHNGSPQQRPWSSELSAMEKKELQRAPRRTQQLLAAARQQDRVLAPKPTAASGLKPPPSPAASATRKKRKIVDDPDQRSAATQERARRAQHSGVLRRHRDAPPPKRPRRRIPTTPDERGTAATSSASVSSASVAASTPTAPASRRGLPPGYTDMPHPKSGIYTGSMGRTSGDMRAANHGQTPVHHARAERTVPPREVRGPHGRTYLRSIGQRGKR